MIPPEQPENEEQRLGALHALNILDTPREERFDRITRMAKHIFKAPIVTVSLVDSDRQWLKSFQGLAECQTSRDVSFCGHTILDDETFIIPDALRDPRFSNNPLVVNEPKIRFYAGHPLLSPDGYRIGAFCILDRRPRRLTREQRQLLKEFAALVQEQLAVVALAEFNIETEKVNKAKFEFLAMMSHELRTPLNSIIGYSEMLHDQKVGKLNKKQSRYAENVLTGGNRLLNTINNILDITKIEAGSMTLDKSRFNLKRMIHETYAMAAKFSGRKDVAINVDVSAEVRMIYADRRKLGSVLFKLIDNAIKFSGDDVRINITAEQILCPAASSLDTAPVANGQAIRPTPHLRIAVSDSGIGIDPGNRSRIFGYFEQSDLSMSRDQEGVGLGLAVVRRLIEFHGGRISVESEGRHKGSTFVFVVPLTAETAGVRRKGDSQQLNTNKFLVNSAKRDLDRELLLIIEDDRSIWEMLDAELSGNGYDLLFTASGEDGIEKAVHNQPDAILLDMMLPQMDGWQVLANLKSVRKTRDIPIIIVSVSDDRELIPREGIVDWFVKPVEKGRLLATLNQIKNA